MKSVLRMLCAAAVFSAALQATILTFDITDIYGNPLANYYAIPDTYGDNVTSVTTKPGSQTFSYGFGDGWTPDVSVSYATRSTQTGVASENTLDFYRRYYGDLRNFAIRGSTSMHIGEIVLTATPGWLVRLNSFELAGYSVSQTTFSVNGQSSTVDLPPSWHYTYSTPVQAAVITILFGLNDSNVGIDNINFSQVQAPPDPVAQTPEGSGLLMTGLGLVLLGILRRR